VTDQIPPGEDKLSNELLMLGAVVAALTKGEIPPGDSPTWVTVPDMINADSAYVWIQTDFLKSRYRLTVTMDPA
jgi:hypothetical protein